MNKSLVYTSAILITLTGCSDRATEMRFPVLPTELKDCKIFRLSNREGDAINVARCPNSTTTTEYSSGKAKVNSIVVDGVEYKRGELK